MEKKEGVLVRVVRDFGFIKVTGENREVFVHKSDYPGPMVEGSYVRLVESAPDPAKGGKTHAQNVEILNTAPQPSQATIVPEAPKGLRVGWKFEWKAVRSPLNVPANQQAEFLELLVTVVLRILDKFQPGYSVGLDYKDGEEWFQVDEPVVNPVTDEDGQTFFRLLLPPDTEYCDLRLQMTAPEGSALTSLAKRWHKAEKVTPTAPVEQTATDAEKNLPEIEVVNPPRNPDPATGLFIVNVVTRKDGNKTNRDFTPFCDQTITVKQEVPGGFAAASAFTAVAAGQYKLFVDFTGVMVKIVFRLDNGKEAVVWLRK